MFLSAEGLREIAHPQIEHEAPSNLSQGEQMLSTIAPISCALRVGLPAAIHSAVAAMNAPANEITPIGC